MRTEHSGCWISGFGFSGGRTPSTQDPIPVIGHRLAVSLSNRHRFVRGIEGFSLIEILMVCVLIGVIAAVIIPPLHQGVQSFTAGETRSDLTSQARQAATRMARELRNIQKEGDNTPYISSANATSITFVDVLDNPATTFSLSGSTVQRNSNPLVGQVSTLQFRYFDVNNLELTGAFTPNNVRRIMVTLTLTEQGQTVSVTEQAFLREMTGL
ncbi:MAG: type II secretion system protein [Candidatus Methylomirabilales bacterium]